MQAGKDSGMGIDPATARRQESAVQTGDEGAGQGGFPKLAATIALSVTIVILVMVGWQLWHSYQGHRITLEEDSRLKQLQGKILLLDEVLTMSARMAAASGDPKWERRYRANEPVLDSTIAEAMHLAKGAFLEKATAQTNSANVGLVLMENRAFTLVRDSQLDQAMALLTSENYEKEKQRYAEGMQTILSGLETRAQSELKRHRSMAYRGLAGVVVALPVILFIWYYVMRLMRINLTERLLAEENRRKLVIQAQQIQKLESLGVLAGGVAHDFNNILAAVLGNADLALRQLPADCDVQPLVHDIREAAVRASQLSEQMLAYSGRGRFIVGPLDLSRLVREMHDLMRSSVQNRNIGIEYKLLERLPAVDADASQMRQIVMNLLANAAQAIGDTVGTIRIETGVQEASSAYLCDVHLGGDLSAGSFAYLEVSDTGCGMNEETLSKLFDPFFSTKFTGRGLGLSAALGIVRGHHGGIKVESQPGMGTTFRVLLPPCGRPADSAAQTHQARPTWRPSEIIEHDIS